MIRSSILALASAAALAGCGQQTANSIGNDLDRTSNAISENANALQADTANAINAAQDALDNQTAAFSNRIDDMSNRLDAAGNALTSDEGNRQ